MLPVIPSDALAFAVFSDVHANRGALEACLARVDALARSLGVDHLPVVFLGDVLDSGPDPAGTLALALARGSLFLRGNHEDYVFHHRADPAHARYLDPLWRFIPWTLERLTATPEARANLDAYERACVFSHSLHDGRVRFFHGSPESNARNPGFVAPQLALFAGASSRSTNAGSVASPPRPQLPPPFEGVVDALCFSGHNHYAGFHENPGHSNGGARELWVNAGSVGYPFVAKDTPDPVATFALVEILEPGAKPRVRVTFERVSHSRHALAAAFSEGGVEGALEACAPFSWAILAQCAFNEDVVFPFFQRAKALGWRQAELPARLEEWLRDGGWRARLETLLPRA